MFQQSALRCHGPHFAPPVVVTNADFRFIVTQQLAAVGVNPGAVLIEPAARNTAPALLAAALSIAQTDPNALILATPSDHYLTRQNTFHQTVLRGIKAAKDGRLVTFGITPDQPETGYGYLELSKKTGAHDTVPLKQFVEKPSATKAAEMLEAGNFMWNSGIFLYSAAALIQAFEKYAPDILSDVTTALERGEPDLGFLRLAPDPWEDCADISIDYAIMEKADNLSVAVHDGDWSDLGGWEAVHQHGTEDGTENDNGVVTSGSVTAVDCEQSLLRSESGNLHLVGLGLSNIIAVAMPDAVLIADRDKAQDVGQLVQKLRLDQVAQANTFPKAHRPWGAFETLIRGERFQVKRIVVNPGAALSLQSHVHRAEHWIVVSGTARVTVGEEIRLLSENESIFVPLGVVHRLENPGKMPMELIEVQTGPYLGEDDILRYDDMYARSRAHAKDAPELWVKDFA